MKQVRTIAFTMLCMIFAGCAINRPPGYDSAAVAAVCATKDGESVAVSFLQQTKSVTVDYVPNWDELYDICGESGGACVDLADNIIYMVDDRRCVEHASHELAHVFGLTGMDTLHEITERRRSYLR